MDDITVINLIADESHHNYAKSMDDAIGDQTNNYSDK